MSNAQGGIGMNRTNNRSDRTDLRKQPGEQNSFTERTGYNYRVMEENAGWEEKKFAERLSELRLLSGVSAREMSLALGQGSGYINNIENGRNLPSMSAFFAICDYLRISPMEFFAAPDRNPAAVNRLGEELRRLDEESLQLLLLLIRKMK